MARGIPALIQPALLVWARESAGLRLDQAAQKSHVKPESLRAWEQGESRPTIVQLRNLGEVYKRPIAVFFLPEPPKGFDAQREFRRLPGISVETESPQMRLALRIALFRRETARNLLELMGEPLPMIRSTAHPNEDPETAGKRIRRLLGIDWDKQLEWPGPYVAMNEWRTAIEQQGVLVFQTGKVDLNEMRGISIPHSPLPVILLNNADAPHGRIFTLVHEFAHVLLAAGGHQTSPMEGQMLPEDRLLERVSNRFAAATIMPKEGFLAETEKYPQALEGENESLRRLANRIKASPDAILRRLLTLRRISPELYRAKRAAWGQQQWFEPPPGEGGPPIQTRVISAVGRSFAALVLEGYHRNAISSTDVSDSLGIQLRYLDRIAAELTI
jgi:Zn-dependent peptidase ImmA (M78 family)/transcriptional regulator with XRE-family HTH domain